MTFDNSRSNQTLVLFHLMTNGTFRALDAKNRTVLVRKIAKDLGEIEAANGNDYTVGLFVTVARQLRSANWGSRLTPYGVWRGIRKACTVKHTVVDADLEAAVAG